MSTFSGIFSNYMCSWQAPNFPISSDHALLEMTHPSSVSITSGVRGLLDIHMEYGKQLDEPVYTRVVVV